MARRFLRHDRIGKACDGLNEFVPARGALDAMNKETARVMAESGMLELRVKTLWGDRLNHDPLAATAGSPTWPKRTSGGEGLNDRLAKLEKCQVL